MKGAPAMTARVFFVALAIALATAASAGKDWAPDGESHCRARRRRRGLSACARHLLGRLPTMAWHTHHLAAGCASDRGQSAPPLGVEGFQTAGSALGFRGALRLAPS
jgi:hypothetical protein